MCKGKFNYRQNMRYQTSTNYELLYDLVMQGNEIPCWVAYHGLPCICTLKKAGKHITCFARDEIIFSCDTETRDVYVYSPIERLKKECEDYALEWLLPVNAEFRNSKGELEYQIMVHSLPKKRSLIYYVIVYSFGNDIRFILDTESDIVPESKYNEFTSALEKHDIVYYNTIEQALAVGLGMVKKLKEQYV